MAGILVLGELAPDGSTGQALDRGGDAGPRPRSDGRDGTVTGVVVGGRSAAAATELAGYVPRVLTVDRARDRRARRGHDHRRTPRRAASTSTIPTSSCLGASPEGRDLAGALSALTGRGVLANAVALSSAATTDRSRPTASSAGSSSPRACLRRGPRHRHDPTEHGHGRAAADSRHGGTGHGRCARCATSPRSPIVDRVAAESAAVSIDDARIIVAGGRGVGGSGRASASSTTSPTALGGAVGATRAAVDRAGSRTASRSARPARSSSPSCTWPSASAGRSSTRSGCRRPSTIVAVNRDPDAPIADFADMIVIGDLSRSAPPCSRSSARGRADGGAGTPVVELASCCPLVAFLALAIGFAIVLPASRGDRRADPRGRRLHVHPCAT